ncbi:unnamed protein product, partial [Discosporangium mesarthrocarpum]
MYVLCGRVVSPFAPSTPSSNYLRAHPSSHPESEHTSWSLLQTERIYFGVCDWLVAMFCLCAEQPLILLLYCAVPISCVHLFLCVAYTHTCWLLVSIPPCTGRLLL